MDPKVSTKNRLRHFMGDGVWASVCEGIAESNFNALATVLRATPGHLSLLAASHSLVGCWLQLWSEKLIGHFGSRKRLVLSFVGFQALLLFLICLATALGASAALFMLLVLLFIASGSTAGAIWSSWISDLLPARRRGFCFGVRNQRTYPLSALSLLTSGFILQYIEHRFGPHTGTRIAFCTIFVLGFCAKLLSLRHLRLQPEIPFRLPAITYGPLQLISACYRDRPTRHSLSFFMILGFAINFSGAFQVPYLLNTLGFSYLQLTATTALFVFARFLAAPWVGRIVDARGSRKPFIVASALISVIALGWAVSRSFYAILMTQFFAGLIWTGYEVFAFTFLVENTASGDRHRIFAARQVSWNFASFAGGLAGAGFAALVAAPSAVFWVSFLIRIGAAIWLVGLPLQPFATEPKSDLLAPSTEVA